MRRLARRRTAAAAVLAVAALALPVPARSAAGAPAAELSGPDCASVTADSVDERTVRGTNEANARLQIPRAQELAAALARGGGRPGSGVTVVVVDTPFGARGPGTVAPRDDESGHGLAVAGIVDGADQTSPERVAVGIAPGATVRQEAFYTTPEPEKSDSGQIPMATNLSRVLARIADGRTTSASGGRVIVLVPTQVPHTKELEKQVARLVSSGVLVIAASGDRPGEGEFPEGYQSPPPGEDVAGVVWPAAAPGVLAVGVAEPAPSTVLRSSRIDLAAPGAGAVSRGRNGGWCVLPTPSTHWASAQVAAIAALVWSAHPDDDAAAVATRLQQTASGAGARHSAVTGYGIVQPVEALQRRVDAAATPAPDPMTPAPPPRAEADVLAGTRRDAVWWGLGGGAALVVLMVVRPLLSRRR